MSLDDLLVDLDDIGGDAFSSRQTPPLAPAPAARTAQIPPVSVHAPLPAPADASDTPVPAAMLGVEFTVTVELGHAAVPLRDLLTMPEHYRFALTGHEGEALSLYVNDQLIARGEALVVDGALAVKIVELLPMTPVTEERAV